MATVEQPQTYAAPGEAGSPVAVQPRYENFIGGEWVAPVEGRYHENLTPATGAAFTEVPASTPADIELALDAAHAAFPAWSESSSTQRSAALNAVADAIDENLEMLAVAESWENGKPVRETLAADIPLAADHFRYFASVIRGEEGSIGEIDKDTMAYHFREPLGVVGLITPWNFPLAIASWKVAPALAAGNTVVLKPAELTPLTAVELERIALEAGLPEGVLNVVVGPGRTVGQRLVEHPGVAKIAFTGSTPVGQRILHAAADNLIPSTVELGGKSPNIFFADVMDADDEFFDKALEGFSMFALNQGEVCTCPSRILVQESIYERFMERAVARVQAMKQGHPLDKSTMVGAQVSQAQLDRILGYIDIGRGEGAKCLTGGERMRAGGEINDGFFIKPTLLYGQNDMRVFQEEIFGPVASVTTFKDVQDAVRIANDTEFGLGAGVWSRNGSVAYHMGRAIQAGRVWTNCYHLYPAHAAFGGYKKSGIGRETHKLALSNYQQTKNLLVSYNPKALGFF